MGKYGFYAVKVGHTPGVYRSWAECEAQVKGVPKASFKGFKTQAEAEAFAGVTGVTTAATGGAGGAAAATAAATTASAAAPKRSCDEALGTAASVRGDATLLEGAVNLAIYTDGSCFGNVNVHKVQQPAGWSAVVVRLPGGPVPPSASAIFGAGGSTKRAKFNAGLNKKGGGQQVAVELFGPVVTPGAVAGRPSLAPFSLAAEVGSNNTGELCGIAEALLWVRDYAPHTVRKVDIRYDSKYAAMSTTGRFNGEKNKALIRESRKALKGAKQPRAPPSATEPAPVAGPASGLEGSGGGAAAAGKEKKAFGIFAMGKRGGSTSSDGPGPHTIDVTFTHVKGHSGDVGNERADVLAKHGCGGHCCQVGRWASLAGPGPPTPTASA